jgi:phenylpyruvate tautomerase PptA (4-oxalocrotonate tautomerase family)
MIKPRGQGGCTNKTAQSKRRCWKVLSKVSFASDESVTVVVAHAVATDDYQAADTLVSHLIVPWSVHVLLSHIEASRRSRKHLSGAKRLKL